MIQSVRHFSLWQVTVSATLLTLAITVSATLLTIAITVIATLLAVAITVSATLLAVAITVNILSYSHLRHFLGKGVVYLNIF